MSGRKWIKCYLENFLDALNYSQQKCHLKNELSEFLHALDLPKIFYTALPDDVRKFLVFQERKGRTQIHTDTCEFKGHVGEKSCDYPTTLAAKSVDSLVGKIRAIFRDIGRSGDWNPVFLTKNPAVSHVIKRHLQSVTFEQSVQGVAKKKKKQLFRYCSKS